MRAIEKYTNKKELNNSFKPLKPIFQMRTRPRMLDISSNPLTALYFACENLKHDEDGEVLFISVKKSDICFYDSDKISCLTNLAKLTTKQKDQLSQYIVQCQKNNSSKTILDKDDLKEKVYEQYLHCILDFFHKSFFTQFQIINSSN